MVLKILSFDCANRTLGYCCLCFDLAAYLRGDLRAFIRVIAFGVIDVIEKKINDTNLVSRAKSFAKTIEKINEMVGEVDSVLIESQPMFNRKSNEVSAFIAFYYYSHPCVIMVSPKLKDRVALAPHLELREFERLYSRAYAARKEHSVESVRFLFKCIDLDIDKFGIRCNLLNNAADACLQAIAVFSEASGQFAPIIAAFNDRARSRLNIPQ